MTIPTAPADSGPGPIDDLHRRLSARGSAVLPEMADPGLRLTLGDAMMATVVLACGFALARTSAPVGVGFLLLAVPGLARTSLLTSRRRARGASPDPWSWAVAFVSSMIRVTATLAVGAIAYGSGLVVGGYGLLGLAHRLGPGEPILQELAFLTAILLGALLATPALVLVGLCLLPIREGWEA